MEDSNNFANHNELLCENIYDHKFVNKIFTPFREKNLLIASQMKSTPG